MTAPAPVPDLRFHRAAGSGLREAGIPNEGGSLRVEGEVIDFPPGCRSLVVQHRSAGGVYAEIRGDFAVAAAGETLAEAVKSALARTSQ